MKVPVVRTDTETGPRDTQDSRAGRLAHDVDRVVLHTRDDFILVGGLTDMSGNRWSAAATSTALLNLILLPTKWTPVSPARASLRFGRCL